MPAFFNVSAARTPIAFVVVNDDGIAPHAGSAFHHGANIEIVISHHNLGEVETGAAVGRHAR